MGGNGCGPGLSQEGIMKKHPRILVFGLSLLAGCTPTAPTRTVQREETRGDGQTTVEKTTEVTRAERETYQKQMQQHLDDLNKEMERWREKIGKAAATAKEEM